MTRGPAPFFTCSDVTIWQADARTAWRWLPERSVDAIVTSPPYYGLRDYGVPGQLGLEASPEAYVEGLADLLTSWGTTVLRPGGSLWLNLGDTYATRSGWHHDPNATSTLQGASQSQRRRGATSALAATRNARSAGATGGFAAKCLLMIPERVALALIARGWILRNKVVWAKPNAMPTSVADRLANTWEHLFHLVRVPRYAYDLHAIRDPLNHPEAADGSRVFGGRHKGGHGRTGAAARTTGQSAWGAQPRPPGQPPSHGSVGAAGAHRDHPHAHHPSGRNPGDYWQPDWTADDDFAAAEVWAIPTSPYPEAHFAVFPQELVRRPILATVPEGGLVADPFAGSGTTAVMARRLGRRALLVELNPDYCALAARRLNQDVLPLEGLA